MLRDRVAVALILLFIVVEITYLASFRNAFLFLIGAGLGGIFVATKLGFTGAWRELVVSRDARGFLATLVLLALATTVFIPVLSIVEGTVPNRAPVGLSLLVGSLLFGIGMQLGGGCGSGTVVGAGLRSTHSVIAMMFFIPGSLLGALQLPWWLSLGPSKSIDLANVFGVGGVVVAQLAIITVIALIAVHRGLLAPTKKILPAKRVLIGAVFVVVLALLVLLVSGRMWSVTFAYTLWGAKAAELLGADMGAYVFWQSPYASAALRTTVFADVTTMTTLGMLCGATVAGLWRTGIFSHHNFYKLKMFVAAMLGGLLMGYGARLAFGCNIGALFSGTASASLHGWIWFAAAWIGSLVGIGMRPKFGLRN